MERLKRVLIVDPTPDWCELLKDLLSKANIYVQAVSSVEQALTKLNEDFFHLIILDIQIEKRGNSYNDLFCFFENLRAIGINDAIKVIILTDHTNNEHINYTSMRIAFSEYHVVDFLFKKEYDPRTWRPFIFGCW